MVIRGLRVGVGPALVLQEEIGRADLEPSCRVRIVESLDVLGGIELGLLGEVADGEVRMIINALDKNDEYINYLNMTGTAVESVELVGEGLDGVVVGDMYRPLRKTLDEVEPRIPITSVPLTISQPGSYYLTGNLGATDTAITAA